MGHVVLLVGLVAGLLGAPRLAEATGATVMRHGRITCDTTVGGVQIVAENPARLSLNFRNIDASADVYYGSGLPAALTTTTGRLLQAGEDYRSDNVPWNYTGLMKCIVASGSAIVIYEEHLR